tara:strand:+ start:270 stop:437 length:168 start_codon:yes stop_codon:yes gene_type:complete
MNKFEQPIQEKVTPIQVEHDITGFAINDKFVIAWSDQDILYLPINQDFSSSGKKH